MKLGGMYGKHERVFLLSSTHGAETHALIAAMKTIDESIKHNVCAHIDKIGLKLQKKINQIIEENQLSDIMNVYGVHGGRQAASFKASGKYSAAQIKTYFFQEIIAQGILFNGYFSPSFCHKDREIDSTIKAWSKACQKLKIALADQDLEEKLVGPLVKPTFRKYN
jgi:glutamate-1-semialdehyde 2,1-aminomutase